MESYSKKEDLKYFNEKYCFNNALSNPIIINQIFQFLDKYKCLSLIKRYIRTVAVTLKI